MSENASWTNTSSSMFLDNSPFLQYFSLTVAAKNLFFPVSVVFSPHFFLLVPWNSPLRYVILSYADYFSCKNTQSFIPVLAPEILRNKILAMQDSGKYFSNRFGM